MISTGPNIQLVVVPELVGLDVETAKEMLDERNLKYGISYIHAEEAEGTVLFQSIKQQEQVKEGTTINLQVSNGPKKETDAVIPDNIPTFTTPRVIWIPMPSGKETVEVAVVLDGEVQFFVPLELVTLSDQGLPIALEDVTGIHEIQIYLDNKVDEKVNLNLEPWYTMQYNFDTGEQVE